MCTPMCGIHGIFSRSLSKEEIVSRVAEMGRVQQHRGPDDQREEVYSLDGGWLGFGFVRLSILDLDTGMQPIRCVKDGSAIICNGQIYNYIELKAGLRQEQFISKGDIEVVLHLYRRHGLSFLQRLNGMYAGAIFDPVANNLLLFRDRFGIKPLYYTECDGVFAFSSEIKALLTGSGLRRRLNESRLATLFSCRYLAGEETMFQGVKRLAPGSFLQYDFATGTVRVERYWEYKLDREDYAITIDEACERFSELFRDAVRIRLRSDVEIGCLLSAGIDSSSVASQAAGYAPGIRLFTISFGEEAYNELPQVEQFLRANKMRFMPLRSYSRRCGKETLNELPGIIRSLEEPLFLGAVLPTDQACNLASEYVKVALTGEGADEIFAGYRKFMLETAAHEYHELPRDRQEELKKEFPEMASYLKVRESDAVGRYIQSEQLFGRADLRRLLGIEPRPDLFPEDALPRLSGREHPLNCALAMESRSRLPDYVILRLDKLSMRHSLETRTPFLDYRLAEFAATLPVGFKINLNPVQEKFICRRAFLQHDILDGQTAFRKKQPLTSPLAQWLSDPGALPDFLQDLLRGGMVEKQGILNGEMVKELVEKVSAEGIGPATLVSDADRVFAVIVFTLWYREFFESAQ